MSPAGGHSGRQRFPVTRRSLLAAVRAPDSQARRLGWDGLVEGYWRPVYKYLRWQWQIPSEDARDLTQEFFTAAYAQRIFDGYDPALARFRTFLRLCLDRFAGNQRKAANRLKRGGGRPTLSLDFAGAEAELRLAETSAVVERRLGPEELFHREWVRSLFGLAVADLRHQCEASGHAVHFEIFARYDLADVADVAALPAAATPESTSARGVAPAMGSKSLPGSRLGGRPTYAALAAELGLSEAQVTNYLAAARGRLRRLVLLRLRSLTVGEAEFRSEARSLLGIEPAPEAGQPGTTSLPAVS